MTRDLSKGIHAQKAIEGSTKSKFGHFQEKIHGKPDNLRMVKLTATVEQADLDYLKAEVLRRSQEQGTPLNVSSVLREILQEHRKKTCRINKH